MPDSPTPSPVAFLDVEGVLLDLHPVTGWSLREHAQDLLSALAKDRRLGVLCNLPRRHDSAALRLLLRDYGLEAWFEPDLLLFASQLPTPLPDRRAFAIAQALAETSDVLYVTANDGFAQAAQAAGWQVEAPPQAQTEDFAPAAKAAAVILAGEVDEDSGGTFVLQGRIVTMEAGGEVIDDGRLVVHQGKIAAVLHPGAPLPAAFAHVPVTDTQSTLYPGLIDLHNHLPYNIIPLWEVPEAYTNRDQWRRNPQYKSGVSQPVVALAKHGPTAKALVRYVETKAMMGATTTGQGMRMIEQGVTKHFVGSMRNVESTNDVRLPEAFTRVPDINPNRPSDLESFRRNLDRATAFFYHMSEGIDAEARNHFLNLQQNDLLGQPLVGIHALGLNADDLTALGAAGGKVVWSPLSNLLLYGQTVELAQLLQSGVKFCLGCDWSPSGSKNPLLELKTARWVAQQQQAEVSDRDLVAMVTSRAAEIVGWASHLGVLAEGKLADIIAVAGTQDDPYAHLINARERAVQLVMIHGTPRYGAQHLMHQLLPGSSDLEDVTVDEAAKTLYLTHPQSTINELTFTAATARLQGALNDLPGFINQSQKASQGLMALNASDDSLRLVLDMEHEDADASSGMLDAGLKAVQPATIAPQLRLDPAEVADAEFWRTMAAQPNLPPGLAQHLQTFYN